jgi:hypothetical protein
VSFWQDGTLYRTWAPIGQQPRVDTYGNRNTAHVYGAIEVEQSPRFHYQFAEKFNGRTFHIFLQALLAAYDTGKGNPPKLFLILDNGPCHNLDADGKAWLAANGDRIALHRLPPYSPEYNGIEGCWKTTRKLATHNAFHPTPKARDDALIRTFEQFKAEPALVAGHVRRFHG